MYEGDTQLVLRCRQCNKPFDKESTLKRHGYYCRSRKVGSSIRARSCLLCAGGKARCDNESPACARCVRKGVECHYPAKVVENSTSKRKHGEPARRQSKTLSTTQVEEVLLTDSTLLDNAYDTLDLNLTRLGESTAGLDDPELDMTNYLGSFTTDELIDRSSWGPSNNQSLAPLSSPTAAFPPPSVYFQRSFVQRPAPHPRTQRIASLIFHTLKSYPLMMLRDNQLPPFIHPYAIAFESTGRRTEVLDNCMSLVQMISQGRSGSRKLFWKNVQLECERLCEEHTTLTKWESLAALQALSVYILIRMGEGETEHNNLDFLLLAASTTLVRQLIYKDTMSDTEALSPTVNTIESEWEAWIWEDSKRRASIILRVINLLVYFEPSTMCSLKPGVILAALPSRKQLWESPDAATWKAEFNKDSQSVQKLYGLAANGDLVRIDDGWISRGGDDVSQQHNSRQAAEPWEEWCAGMDGLGALVMLVASLVG